MSNLSVSGIFKLNPHKDELNEMLVALDGQVDADGNAGVTDEEAQQILDKVQEALAHAKPLPVFVEVYFPDHEIRVVDVPQPHAWAIVNGHRDVLNNYVECAGAYRGYVAIRAMEQDKFDSFYFLNDGYKNIDVPAEDELEYGKIVGVAQLVSEIEPVSFLKPSEWARDDAYYWTVFTEAIALDEGIEYRPVGEQVQELDADVQVRLLTGTRPFVRFCTEKDLNGKYAGVAPHTSAPFFLDAFLKDLKAGEAFNEALIEKHKNLLLR